MFERSEITKNLPEVGWKDDVESIRCSSTDSTAEMFTLLSAITALVRSE